MPEEEEYTVRMTLRLTPLQAKLRDALAKHLGVDATGVVRQALLKLAREEGITVSLNEESGPSHKTPAKKRR